jgi:hypothetical protein
MTMIDHQTASLFVLLLRFEETRNAFAQVSDDVMTSSDDACNSTPQRDDRLLASYTSSSELRTLICVL